MHWLMIFFVVLFGYRRHLFLAVESSGIKSETVWSVLFYVLNPHVSGTNAAELKHFSSVQKLLALTSWSISRQHKLGSQS